MRFGSWRWAGVAAAGADLVLRRDAAVPRSAASAAARTAPLGLRRNEGARAAGIVLAARLRGRLRLDSGGLLRLRRRQHDVVAHDRLRRSSIGRDDRRAAHGAGGRPRPALG